MEAEYLAHRLQVSSISGVLHPYTMGRRSEVTDITRVVNCVNQRSVKYTALE